MKLWGRVLCADNRESTECIDLPMRGRDLTSIAYILNGIKYRLVVDQQGGAVYAICKKCTRRGVRHAA